MQISWVNRKLKRTTSRISRQGVFATADIKKGERIAVFGGYCIDMKEIKNLKRTKSNVYRTIIRISYQVDDDIVFSPVASSQFSTIEYLNHSCEANCGFEGPIHLVALRNIKKGEEITMDYGTCITSPLFNMTCRCGSARCRGLVSSNDWRSPRLQRQYGKYFQPFILEKIRKDKKSI